MMIADVLTVGSSPWNELYDPSRKIGSNIGAFISENITPLFNFAEYLSADDITTVEKLKAGEGRVVRSGLNKIAACRDKDGELHLHSASCTHLGCVVLEYTQCWDCPCHGSQFAPDGTALNGRPPSSRVQKRQRLAAGEPAIKHRTFASCVNSEQTDRKKYTERTCANRRFFRVSGLMENVMKKVFLFTMAAALAVSLGVPADAAGDRHKPDVQAACEA